MTIEEKLRYFEKQTNVSGLAGNMQEDFRECLAMLKKAIAQRDYLLEREAKELLATAESFKKSTNYELLKAYEYEINDRTDT